jgi:hypothetical protein
MGRLNNNENIHGKNPFELVYGIEAKLPLNLPNSYPLIHTTIRHRCRGNPRKNKSADRIR